MPISRVFETLSINMGSSFVNDFNILGRTYRVTAQADNPYRLVLRDVANLETRSDSGFMVPLGSIARFEDIGLRRREAKIEQLGGFGLILQGRDVSAPRTPRERSLDQR